MNHKVLFFKKLGDKLELMKVSDNESGLELVFHGEKFETVTLLFDSSESYRFTEETYRNKFIRDHEDLLQTDTILYKTYSSEYLQWLEEESFIENDKDLCHYIILTPSHVLDILSFEDPVITKSVQR